MHRLKELQQLIGKKIEDISFRKEPEELYDPICYIMTIGGKRLRPVLTLMSCEMFGGDVEDAIMPALGMETFHNFTLVHDDIMDNADVRRGMATVHKKWNRNVAILSGDAMLILANQFMMQVDDDILREVMQLYNAYGLQVCDGQQYDMNFEATEHISIEQYVEMIELKTAALLAGCLRLGAVLAKTSEENKDLIEQFGHHLGVSFQIEDDRLDAFGNFEKFGKKIGGDILENKKTFIYLKALEIAGKEQQKELKHWFGSTNFDPQEKIDAVLRIYRELEVEKFARKESEKYFENAIVYLKKIQVQGARKKQLYDVADYLINRDY